MRKLTRFVSPVLPINLGLLIVSFVVVRRVGFIGPCGFSSSWGIVRLLGYPVGLVGTVVRLVLSAIRTRRYFR